MCDDTGAVIVIVDDCNEFVRFQNARNQTKRRCTLFPTELFEESLFYAIGQSVVLADHFLRQMFQGQETHEFSMRKSGN